MTYENILLLSDSGSLLNGKAPYLCMLYNYIASNCYNSCRYGKKPILRLVKFQLKRLAIRCPRSRSNINLFGLEFFDPKGRFEVEKLPEANMGASTKLSDPTGRFLVNKNDPRARPQTYIEKARRGQ